MSRHSSLNPIMCCWRHTNLNRITAKQLVSRRSCHCGRHTRSDVYEHPFSCSGWRMSHHPPSNRINVWCTPRLRNSHHPQTVSINRNINVRTLGRPYTLCQHSFCKGNAAYELFLIINYARATAYMHLRSTTHCARAFAPCY